MRDECSKFLEGNKSSVEIGGCSGSLGMGFNKPLEDSVISSFHNDTVVLKVHKGIRVGMTLFAEEENMSEKVK